MWTSRGPTMASRAFKSLAPSVERQEMPRSFSRDLHSSSRALSSAGAGPSTLRARPGSYHRLPPSRGTFHGRRYFSVDLAISSTFDSLQSTLEYPTTFVSHIINNSPIAAHGVTIILLAIFVRTVLTLPPTLWQRRQRDKMDSLIPELKAFELKTAKKLIVPFRKQRNEKGFMEALEREIKDEQRYLYKTHGIHPQLSRWGPIAYNLSLLITMSTAVRAAVSGPGNNMAQESFAWVSHLGEPDLPLSITAGIVAFGIAELSGWQGRKKDGVDPALSSQKAPKEFKARPVEPATPTTSSSRPVPPPPPLSRPRPMAMTRPTKPSSPPRTVSRTPHSTQRPFSSSSTSALPSPGSPTQAGNALGGPQRMPPTKQQQAELLKSLLTNTMRVAAVGLLLLTSQMPAGVTLYICTSLVYTFGQIFVFGRIDKRRRRPLSGTT